MFQITTGEKGIVGAAVCMGVYVACQETHKLYYSHAVRNVYRKPEQNLQCQERWTSGANRVPVGRGVDPGRTDPLGELKAVTKVGSLYGAVSAGVAGAALAALVYRGNTEEILKCGVLAAGAGGVTGSVASVSRRILRV